MHYLANSKIIINAPPYRRKLNVRVFKALGVGSLLITEDDEVRKLFMPYKHLLVFRGPEELLELLSSIDENRAESIAQEGLRRALNNHTIYHRVYQLLDSIGLVDSYVRHKYQEMLKFLMKRFSLLP